MVAFQQVCPRGRLDPHATQTLVRVTDANGNVTDLRVKQTLEPGSGRLEGTTWYSLSLFAFDTISKVETIREETAGNYVIAATWFQQELPMHRNSTIFLPITIYSRPQQVL